ncbi:MAG TPA: serine hydrolase [Cyclobacteriaceae bacterium]|nr:serine hydrolase [Cyclobacteriaceae bacterium]
MRSLCIFSLVIFHTLGHCQDYPDNDWKVIDNLERSGWDEDKLNALGKFLADSAATTGMMVIHQGRVVFQYGNVTDNSYMASCRKSILSLIYGPYVESGRVDLDRTIEQLGLDDVGGLLPLERKATIRHLLTARSGVYHPASNEGDQSNMAPKRGSVSPGSYFLYNNWDFNIAGFILEQAANKNIYDIVDSVLAKPLEMQDWDRKIQRKYGDSTKSIYPAYHMWFSTRDMARIGLLMLTKGQWKNKQVVSSKWVKTITTPVTTYEEALKNKTNYFKFSYGYLWWLWNDDGPYRNAYTATGAFGQFITVLPALNVVIAHKTNYDKYRTNTPTDLYLRIVDKVVASRDERK